MNTRLYSFVGGETGPWCIERMSAPAGPALTAAQRLDVVCGAVPANGASWVLRGVTSNERYVAATEKEQLLARQQGLGRPDCTCAALIALRKSDAWWALPQDARRRIFEERSAHIEIGLRYLPAVARRLHHCRDLANPEPFDFVTWFDFAPKDAPAFERLLAQLRATEEWGYVEREVDVRLTRAHG